MLTIRAKLTRLRLGAGSMAAEGLFHGLSAMGRLHPASRPARHGVTVEKDLAYLDDGLPEHRLDIYRPAGRPTAHTGRPAQPSASLLPIVLYIHGGGFRILSKDTHWLMGLAFARRGYLVFNVNYRLAPRHPFPAAIEDVCAAFEWVVANAARRGGDPSRLVIAGESAGGNLATSLAIATTFERPEPYAARVFSTGVVPTAVLPACPILQVSDTDRFLRRRPLPRWLHDRIAEVQQAYLKGWHAPAAGELDLADPIVLLESDAPSARPLPPFFATVGTRDPILDDTRRLDAALGRRRVTREVRYYPGEAHAFHALVFRAAARRCWQDTFTFLDRYAPAS